MDHLLDILKKELARIKAAEDAYRYKNDPLYISRIGVLEKTEKALNTFLESPKHNFYVGEVLQINSVFDAFAEGLTDYNRGLFRVKNRLNDSFIKGMMYLVNGKYKETDFVGHYDGHLFEPKDINSWKDILRMDENELLAVYASHTSMKASKQAIDAMGGIIGDEIEIPFLEDETGEYKYTGNSDVERLISSDYSFSADFPDGLKLTEDLTAELVERSSVPQDNTLNRGLVSMLYNHKRINVKNLSSICYLNGSTVSELDFIFRGGYLKDAAYSILFGLGKIKEEKPDLSHYEKAKNGNKTDEIQPEPETKNSEQIYHSE